MVGTARDGDTLASVMRCASCERFSYPPPLGPDGGYGRSRWGGRPSHAQPCAIAPSSVPTATETERNTAARLVQAVLAAEVKVSLCL